MCVWSWMTVQGLWTLRPGWRIERPLEAPWKPLQPALTPPRGRGAREERSKPERRGQGVDMKQKIQGASIVQGSICGLCRISKRVSTVSKRGIKTRKSMLLLNAGYSRVGWTIALRGYARPNGTQLLWWQGCCEDITVETVSDACWIPEFWTSGRHEQHCKQNFKMGPFVSRKHVWVMVKVHNRFGPQYLFMLVMISMQGVTMN